MLIGELLTAMRVRGSRGRRQSAVVGGMTLTCEEEALYVCCIVTGNRCLSSNLPQGGLEILCSLLFTVDRKEIMKLKKVLKGTGNILSISSLVSVQ